MEGWAITPTNLPRVHQSAYKAELFVVAVALSGEPSVLFQVALSGEPSVLFQTAEGSSMQ